MRYSKDNFKSYLEKTGEVGAIKRITFPIVYVDGLPSVSLFEVVLFENGELGQVVSINFDMVEVLVFARSPVSLGERVVRVDSVIEVPVGADLLGKVLDPLGQLLYEKIPVQGAQEFRPIERQAPGIDQREKIDQPLETGVAVVDLMVPLGKGQRQLVIGDRKTGKTSFLLQTLLNQGKKGVVCIYAGIGKKKSNIKQVETFLKAKGIFENSLIVASTSSDSPGVIFLTPYTAMTIAEYFRDQGKDVLVILDDLTSHAKFYRELSLLAGNFPGRNAYPGDIFYTHARLLERAGNFKSLVSGSGSASITCIPVSETVEGDISGYIQTNLMSMTDGHIYFDNDLFAKGRRPAVNFFLSVTRVGRQTQSKVRSGINRELNSFLSLHSKTQSFVHFGAELGQGVRTTLALGDKVLEFFNQHPDKILPLNLQIALFSLIWIGNWSKLSPEDANKEYEKIILTYYKDESFRNFVNSLVDKSEDFNVLLGKMSTESTKLLEMVGNAGTKDK